MDERTAAEEVERLRAVCRQGADMLEAVSARLVTVLAAQGEYFAPPTAVIAALRGNG